MVQSSRPLALPFARTIGAPPATGRSVSSSRDECQGGNRRRYRKRSYLHHDRCGPCGVFPPPEARTRERFVERNGAMVWTLSCESMEQRRTGQSENLSEVTS